MDIVSGPEKIDSLATVLLLTQVLKRNAATTNDNNVKLNETANNTTKRTYAFKDYLLKFNPAKVKQRLDKQQKLNGVNVTKEEYFQKMFEGVDEVDEILKLRVHKAEPAALGARRAWSPPGYVLQGIYWQTRDAYLLRPRLMELMKFHIYDLRDKLVIMQILREKYKRSALYKMGFLFSKTDQTCKQFSSIAYKAFRACSGMRQGSFYRMTAYELVEAEERLLSLWFDRDLLVDMIRYNDQIARNMLQTVETKRKREFDKRFAD